MSENSICLRIQCNVAADAQALPLGFTVSYPVQDLDPPRDWYCLVTTPELPESESKIYGVSPQQAYSLAVEYVTSVLRRLLRAVDFGFPDLNVSPDQDEET